MFSCKSCSWCCYWGIKHGRNLKYRGAIAPEISHKFMCSAAQGLEEANKGLSQFLFPSSLFWRSGKEQGALHTLDLLPLHYFLQDMTAVSMFCTYAPVNQMLLAQLPSASIDECGLIEEKKKS